MLAWRSSLSDATVAVSVLSDMAYTRVYYLSDVFAMVWFVKRLINDKRYCALGVGRFGNKLCSITQPGRHRERDSAVAVLYRTLLTASRSVV